MLKGKLTADPAATTLSKRVGLARQTVNYHLRPVQQKSNPKEPF
jgi:hypothetical protein